MPLLGGIFGSKSGEDTEFKRQSDFWTPEQKESAKRLYSGTISPGLDRNQFTGQPTDIENMTLANLRQFTGSQPTLFPEATGALNRALTGQGYSNIVDPAAAEKLYGTIQDRTFQDILPQAVRSAAGEANIGGMLRSGTGQKLVTDEIGRITRALSETLAGLKYADEQERRSIEREREGRQLQGVGQAGTLQNLQLGQMMPGLQYGGMERDIAGTQYQNPLTNLILAYLGLRGQEDTTGKSSTSGYTIGGRAGLEFPKFGT